MIYRTKIVQDAKQAVEFLKFAIKNGRTVKIDLHEPKSYNQRAYLHVLLGYLATQLNMPKEYVKQVIYKVEINKDHFEMIAKDRNGNVVKYYRSTEDKYFTKAITSLCIDRLRNFSSESYGIYLPEANEDLSVYEHEIEKYKRWL